jgi:hypothetical protein
MVSNRLLLEGSSSSLPFHSDMTSWRVFWCWESGKYEFISWLGNIPAFIAWATTLVLSSLKW